MEKKRESKIKSNYECALILTHDLIGGKWKLRILWHILKGDNRFSLLEKGIPDITPKVLTSQLRELVESHILEKEVIKKEPPKTIVYQLNEEYATLIPIIESICIFTKEYALEYHIEISGEK